MNGAVLSPCRTWRYTLTRDLVSPLVIGDEISEGDPNTCLFVCLNPSTADETRDDKTVSKCVGYARRWGYSRLVVCNIFALRATDPKDLYASWRPVDVVGPDNDRWIVECARAASLIVCGWGNHGAHLARGRLTEFRLRQEHGLPLHVLGLNKDGSPKHPLYLPGKLEPVAWA